MNDIQRFRRISEIFEAARILPSESRESYLIETCAGDASLMEELRRLLTHHDTSSTPLDTPVVTEEMHSEILRTSQLAPMPTTIGRYTVKRQLGAGGMGVVYLAEQEHPQREVAIKVIRSGAMHSAMIHRFEFEASALGRLHHPGIAQIYEAGVFEDSSGVRPYIVMELVAGAPINQYAEQHALDSRERLALVALVCDAIHHAHQRGIIHRDIKPANIIIDDNGVPRILDFGIARTTDTDQSAPGLHTLPGQLIGTLAYMSPEQILGSSSEVDIRTDVYALGVTLYELLTQTLPIDVGESTLVAAAQMIAESDPVPLSSRSRAFRGDLNTLVLKAIDAVPERRYQSASDLAADIRRFLDHEPIMARPATAIYQIRKFARRHVGFVSGLAVAAIVLLGSSAGIAWNAAQLRTEVESRREVAAFLRDILTSVEPERTAGEIPTIRMMLDEASVRLNDRFDTIPLVGADLHETIGTTYHRIGDFVSAESHLRTAAATYRERYGMSDDRSLAATASLAYTLREMDRLEEADLLLSDAARHIHSPSDPGANSVLVKRAIVLDELGREEEAEELYRSLFERARDDLGIEHVNTQNARLNLGKHLMDQGKLHESLEHIEAACRVLRQSHGDDYPDTIIAISNLGVIYSKLGRFNEGILLITEACDRSSQVLGPTHLHTLRRRQNMALAHWNQDRQDDALAAAHLLLTDCRRELGDAHAQTIRALELDTTFLALSGDIDAAIDRSLDWFDRLSTELGRHHRSCIRVAQLIANLYDEAGSTERNAYWQSVANSSLDRATNDLQ